MSSLTNEKTEPIAGKQRHGTSKFLIGSSKKFRAFAPNISNYPSKFPRIPIFIDVLLFDCQRCFPVDCLLPRLLETLQKILNQRADLGPNVNALLFIKAVQMIYSFCASTQGFLIPKGRPSIIIICPFRSLLSYDTTQSRHKQPIEYLETFIAHTKVKTRPVFLFLVVKTGEQYNSWHENIS